MRTKFSVSPNFAIPKTHYLRMIRENFAKSFLRYAFKLRETSIIVYSYVSVCANILAMVSLKLSLNFSS